MKAGKIHYYYGSQIIVLECTDIRFGQTYHHCVHRAPGATGKVTTKVFNSSIIKIEEF